MNHLSSIQPNDLRDIDPRAFPKHGTRKMQTKFLLQYAVLAPSGHNSQPWKFRLVDNKVEVFADQTKALHVVDPKNREMVISCGAAIGMFQHAARFFGCRAHVTFHDVFSEYRPLATIELLAGPAPEDEEIRLFDAITVRSTQRVDFYDIQPDAQDIHDCYNLALKYNCRLFLGNDNETKQNMANLIANGDRVQFSNPDFRHELAAWLKSKNIGGQDGISSDSFGLPDILTPLNSLVIRAVDLGSSVGKTHAQQVTQSTTVVGLLSSYDDAVESLLKTGMSLSHLLLHLTSRGLSVSFYNEPIEIRALREELAKLIDDANYPQILFRIGYGPEGNQSVRRSAESCIISEK